VSDFQASEATFIVRFWVEDSPEAATWRGVAEQIGRQRQCAFQTLGELVQWMRLGLPQLELVPLERYVQGGCECEDNCADGIDG
jgi:hypothetical protein